MINLFSNLSAFMSYRSFSYLATSVSASLLAIATSLPAQATLTYNIFEDSGNVVIETQGSLNLPSPSNVYVTTCSTSLGAVAKTVGVICTGPDATIPAYQITGPTSLAAGPSTFQLGSSSSGKQTVLFGAGGLLTINSYLSGAPIVASTTFNGQTLASMGFTTLGNIGTWTINGTGDTINVTVGNPVPGPLPLLGAGAALGFSRRLRRRVALASLSGQG